MKSEPIHHKRIKSPWTIDESKCLSNEEVTILRKYCGEIKKQGIRKRKFSLIRTWFTVELGLNTGLRVEEMASLQQSQFFLDNGKSSIVVIGKGAKRRSVLISKAFRRVCLKYFNHKTDFGYSILPDDYALNNLKGRRISKRSLQKFFKNILEPAGLPEHYHIHCLRHTFTTLLLTASNNNYRFAQKQLGHSSLRTTQVYAGVVEQQARKALENLLTFTSKRNNSNYFINHYLQGGPDDGQS